MNLHDKVAVVTGGAHGIGRALSRRFAAEGARGVVVADADADGASEVAREIGGLAVRTDVAIEREVVELVGQTVSRYGRLDLFCSNAGIFIPGGVDVANSDWRRIWDVNVHAHLYAARAVLPHMLDRRQGYLLAVVSAAGLLTQIGSAPYSVTKHAALALAEWLAVTHGDAGIKVSCLCPQGVRTAMLESAQGDVGALLQQGAISPEQCAEAVVGGLREEKFLILPHPDVAKYFQRKANDYDRWLRGMRRLQQKLRDHPGS